MNSENKKSFICHFVFFSFTTLLCHSYPFLFLRNDLRVTHFFFFYFLCHKSVPFPIYKNFIYCYNSLHSKRQVLHSNLTSQAQCQDQLCITGDYSQMAVPS